MNQHLKYQTSGWCQWRTLVIAALIAVCCGDVTAASRSISEPETLLYGQVVNRSGGSSRIVTQGRLRWIMVDSDGQSMELESELSQIGGGLYSYRLPIPHSAVALALPVEDGTVAFGGSANTLLHTGVSVDGEPAKIVWPGDVSVDLSAANRAAAIRVDLEITVPESDLDGDGIPDWWEEANGLDSVSATDAQLDPDNDGRSNLEEFIAGSDPNENSNQPTLLSSEVFAYAEGNSGVLLEVDDADSSPDQLVLTLESVPVRGQLRLRHAVDDPANPDRSLIAGDEFSFDAVRGGRLIYVHGGDAEQQSDTFRLQVRDEDPAHDVSSSQVSVRIYNPASEELGSAPDQIENLLPGSEVELAHEMRGFLLSRDHGYVAWELSRAIRPVELALPTATLGAGEYEDHVSRFGSERPQFVTGSGAADILSGGMADDILSGGGGDDDLSGGGGADQFTWTDAGDGHDTVLDFSPADGDVLVAEDFFSTHGSLEEHFRLVQDGEDSLIEIGLPGNGIDYSDLSIRLVGFFDSDVSLRSLVRSGVLRISSLELTTQITISKISGANENGLISGVFKIQRDGSVGEALTVNLAVGGAAENGVDFAHISDLIVIPAGESHVDIEISPFADALSEPSEIVEITLLSGDGYGLDPAANSVQIPIEDLLPQLSLEVVRGIASRDSGQPALVLLRREGLLERSLFVNLRYSGTAASGTDYTATQFVNLIPGQTSELIRIEPQPGAQFPDGSKSVVLKFASDPSYLIRTPSWAEVAIAAEEETFDLWAERNLGPVVGEDVGSLDPGASGVTNFERYAFRLDPSNPLVDRSRLPKPYLRGDGHLHFEFYRTAEARDIVYELETSTDLISWRPGDSAFERYPAPWADGQPGRTAYRSTTPFEQSEPIFVRVRARPSLP